METEKQQPVPDPSETLIVIVLLNNNNGGKKKTLRFRGYGWNAGKDLAFNIKAQSASKHFSIIKMIQMMRHRWTGRYEAHLWDNSCKKEGQTRKERQGTQEEAAEAYDVAAIKFGGVNAVTNFDISRYDVERIMASNTLLAGESARRIRDSDPRKEAIDYNNANVSSQNNVEGASAVQTQNNEK